LPLSAISAAAAVKTYVSVQIDGPDLDITAADGGVEQPTRDHDSALGGAQTGFSDPKISADGKIVGWLSLYPNCCTSYDIPRELVLYRDSLVFLRLRGNDQSIFSWSFSNDGSAVAYCQGPLHFSDDRHYELRRIPSGELIEEAEAGDGDIPSPQWAADLGC
jgi:hypothetical protein